LYGSFVNERLDNDDMSLTLGETLEEIDIVVDLDSHTHSDFLSTLDEFSGIDQADLEQQDMELTHSSLKLQTNSTSVTAISSSDSNGQQCTTTIDGTTRTYNVGSGQSCEARSDGTKATPVAAAKPVSAAAEQSSCGQAKKSTYNAQVLKGDKCISKVEDQFNQLNDPNDPSKRQAACANLNYLAETFQKQAAACNLSSGSCDVSRDRNEDLIDRKNTGFTAGKAEEELAIASYSGEEAKSLYARNCAN
jgi:hypothetical protein